MSVKRNTVPAKPLREMSYGDIRRAAEWEKSEERRKLLERNQQIVDQQAEISATYSNRC